MVDEKTPYDDEIDLVAIFETIWQEKWIIAAFVAIFIVGMVGFIFLRPAPDFTATTTIRPIVSTDAEQYKQSNDLGFFTVSPETLLDLYLEQLERRVFFEDAIRDLELLKREDFETEQEYDIAVIQLAASIKIIQPFADDEQGVELGSRFWTIEFKYNNADKWRNALESVNGAVSERVKQILQERFDAALALAVQRRQFELEDIDTAMVNARTDFDLTMEEFELNHGFQFEDIQTQIDNVIKDYDRQVSDRLAFLGEQAAIARKLGVAKNTIEAQVFNAQSGTIATVDSETPFYLRGYEAIEKEIELIENREDKRAFVGGLFDLEKKKRALEQDKTLQRAEKNKIFLTTILELDRRKRALLQSKTIERAQELFALTPIGQPDGFSAVAVIAEATEFKNGRSAILLLVLAAFGGGMIGTVYVLISNAMRQRGLTLQSENLQANPAE